MHTLGTEATAAYEGARAKVAAFIGAAGPDEVVFTKNATEAINLVAYAFGNASSPRRPTTSASCSGPATRSSSPKWSTTRTSCRGRCCASGPARRCSWFGITDDGRLDLSRLDEIITERTKLVSIAYVSNILGTVNATAPIVARARQVGALVMLDGSQAVPHMPVDVAALDVDFLAFTGHKMLGPTGIGVLWGAIELLCGHAPGPRRRLHDRDRDDGQRSTFAPPPARFEAGTPPIAEAIALGAAIDYLTASDMRAVAGHEK